MSASSELQTMIFSRLNAVSAVTDLVGSQIYDRVPESRTFPYISFGPSDATEDDEECIEGRVATIQIDCWSRYGGGYQEVQKVADAVKDALHRFEGELTINALVELRWRITRFLRDPDGITSHAAITVEAMIEEA